MRSHPHGWICTHLPSEEEPQTVQTKYVYAGPQQTQEDYLAGRGPVKEGIDWAQPQP